MTPAETTPLTMLWAGIILFAVYAYVVLDGFDLGLGLLFPLFPEAEDRDVLMNTVAPVWDGNETWLILGGGGLFAAFPLAYAILMPALYPLIIAMLLGLIFRGVAFEYRWRTDDARWVWDLSFISGSLIATLCQGLVLGAIVQGIEVEGREFAGHWLDWLTPFSLLTGVAVVSGYLLLGTTWLVMKTTGQLQERARTLAWVFGVSTIAFIAAVSLATPFVNSDYWTRWFDGRQALFSSVVPIAIGVITLLLFRSLKLHDHEYRPFVLTLMIFALCFAGLAISVFPNIVPPDITLQEAASPESSQLFMLVGTSISMPLILGYTAYAYWIFRGKMDPDSGYH